jgi:hypothetical protein
MDQFYSLLQKALKNKVMCAILLIGKKYNKMFENTKEVIMKKFYALLSFLIMIVFVFGCEFNLFEASVETNYKNIKDPATRLNYAEQVLLGGNADDISTILDLLKADFEKDLFGTENDELWIRANRIIGNAYVTSSGVEDIVTNVVTGLIATASSSETPEDITTIIADIDGSGTVDEGDLALLADMLENMAEGAEYLNAAAQASPEDLDLQLENIIANLTAAIITVMNMEGDITAKMDAFSNYLETGNSGGWYFSEVEGNIQNAAYSVNNILDNATPGSPTYEIASALNEFLYYFTNP